MISNQNCLENICDSKSILATKSLTNQQHKDTTLTKIFVGGLPYHTTDESLKIFFESFGPIEEAVVITDRQSGKSRGYGFVTMVHYEDAYRAISNPNPCIDGRKANVNLAILGAKPRILPGVNLNSMALSRLVPIQSLVPQTPSIYNNLMMTPLMAANLIGMQQQNIPSQLNLASLRNVTPYGNSIYNVPSSPAMSNSVRNNYPFIPFSVNPDSSLLSHVPANNPISSTPSNSQLYLATQQYLSALNLQQINNLNPIGSSVNLLNSNTEASAAQISQSTQNYQIDPSFFV